MTCCATPLGSAEAFDWWLGELEQARALALEEHVFGCASCAGTLEGAGRVVRGLQDMMGAHPPPVITREMLAELRRRGVRMQESRAGADGVARATPRADVDLEIVHVPVDLTGVERVALDVMRPDGAVVAHLPTVLFEPAAGEVIVACERMMAVSMPTVRFRVRGVDTHGERVLAELTWTAEPGA